MRGLYVIGVLLNGHRRSSQFVVVAASCGVHAARRISPQFA
jgi:hypothetical protein